MLAIIIPFYKLKYFEETLKSIAIQTDKRFKVYIGNDASHENPRELLIKYNGKFDFEYQKFESNLGSISLVKQWHRCLTMTKNEAWSMILGDDDVLSENVVESFYKNLNNILNKNINVIRFASYRINEFGENISEIYDHPNIEKSSDFLFRKSRSSLSEYIFNSKVVEEIKFKNFPLAWYSDVLAVLEFSDFGNVFSINEAFLKIRISNESISGQKTNIDLKESATFQFYEYLILNRINEFSSSQMKIIFDKLDTRFINNKKNINIFLRINMIYLKIINFYGLLNFYKSIAKSVFNKFK